MDENQSLSEEITDDKLEILTEPEAYAAGIQEFLSPATISVKKLSANLEDLITKFNKILYNLPQIEEYKLTEIAINVNITAGGELQVIGLAKGEGKVNGGFTLKFNKV